MKKATSIRYDLAFPVWEQIGMQIGKSFAPEKKIRDELKDFLRLYMDAGLRILHIDVKDGVASPGSSSFYNNEGLMDAFLYGKRSFLHDVHLDIVNPAEYIEKRGDKLAWANVIINYEWAGNDPMKLVMDVRELGYFSIGMSFSPKWNSNGHAHLESEIMELAPALDRVYFRKDKGSYTDEKSLVPLIDRVGRCISEKGLDAWIGLEGFHSKGIRDYIVSEDRAPFRIIYVRKAEKKLDKYLLGDGLGQAT